MENRSSIEGKRVPLIPRELTDEVYYKNHIILSYDIKYPEFLEVEEGLARVNKYYKENAGIFQRDSQIDLYRDAVRGYNYSVKNDYPVRRYESLMNYVIPYNQKNLLSIYIDEYTYSGGAHGNTVRSARTWNILTGEIYDLEDFFRCNPYNREEIIYFLRREAREESKTDGYKYFENYEVLIDQYFEEENFYITSKGLVIFYDLYTITPYASGIVEFTIPFTELCR
jgi:hypothetical protein